MAFKLDRQRHIRGAFWLPFCFSVVVVLVIGTACRDIAPSDAEAVPSDMIYQSYTVNFSRQLNDDGFSAVASFSLGAGGRSLELTLPSRILFNGETMSELSTGAAKEYISYFYEAKKIPTSAVFEWTDSDEATYENTIVIPTVTFSEPDEIISLSTGYSYPLPAKQEGENIYYQMWLRPEDAPGVSIKALTITSTSGVPTSLDLSRTLISGLSPGPAIITVFKSILAPLTDTTEAGGYSRVNNSREFPVTIRE